MDERIGEPALLGLRIDAGRGVEAALDGREHGREKGAFAGKDARHEEAERLHQRSNDERKAGRSAANR